VFTNCGCESRICYERLKLPLGSVLSPTTWQNRHWDTFKSRREWKWSWEENSDLKEF